MDEPSQQSYSHLHSNDNYLSNRRTSYRTPSSSSTLGGGGASGSRLISGVRGGVGRVLTAPARALGFLSGMFSGATPGWGAFLAGLILLAVIGGIVAKMLYDRDADPGTVLAAPENTAAHLVSISNRFVGPTVTDEPILVGTGFPPGPSLALDNAIRDRLLKNIYLPLGNKLSYDDNSVVVTSLFIPPGNKIVFIEMLVRTKTHNEQPIAESGLDTFVPSAASMIADSQNPENAGGATSDGKGLEIFFHPVPPATEPTHAWPHGRIGGSFKVTMVHRQISPLLSAPISGEISCEHQPADWVVDIPENDTLIISLDSRTQVANRPDPGTTIIDPTLGTEYFIEVDFNLFDSLDDKQDIGFDSVNGLTPMFAGYDNPVTRTAGHAYSNNSIGAYIVKALTVYIGPADTPVAPGTM